MTYDFDVIDLGSIITIRPMTHEGREWFSEHVEAVTGGDLSFGVPCDHRCAFDIIDGALDAGLTIGKDGGQLTRAD